MVPPTGVFEATGDAFSATIGEIFDIPEANIDGQLLEMTSGDSSYQEQPTYEDTVPSGSNATAKDGGLDAALIDLLPF
jgi:hypothetical protein